MKNKPWEYLFEQSSVGNSGTIAENQWKDWKRKKWSIQEKKKHNLAALWSLKGWGVKAKWKTKDQLGQFFNSPRKDDVFDHMKAVRRDYLDELGINVRGGHG